MMKLSKKTLSYKIIILGISLGLTVSSAAAEFDLLTATTEPVSQAEINLKLKKNAESGDPFAQFMLAVQYEYGRSSLEKSDTKAFYWYQKAANHKLDNVTDKSNQLAAEAGIRLSQDSLGSMYEEGRGVRQNYSTAAKWYQKAADSGLASAQFKLGLMYEEGRGVRQNYSTAANFYIEAAKKSHSSAKNNLGRLYEKGLGVRQNKSKAKELYGQSCDDGEQISCNNYRILNEQGY